MDVSLWVWVMLRPGCKLQTAAFCNFYADFEGNSEEFFHLKNVINGSESTSILLITKRHYQFHKHIYISSRLYVEIHRLSPSFTLFSLHEYISTRATAYSNLIYSVFDLYKSVRCQRRNKWAFKAAQYCCQKSFTSTDEIFLQR